MKKSKISTISISLLTTIFIISIFIFPSETISAAKHGISLWFNVLFPALFPFMIAANILIGVGAVNFIGKLLEPIMKPIFNISGVGAFPCIMGILSGCPVGAKITGDLRITKQISSTDATRIMSLCNNSGPLFMLGTVSIGMFKNPSLGLYIILVTYLSALSTGLLFRFYGRTEIVRNNRRNNLVNSNKSLGAILSDSIMNAMETITKVGGFVIFFSVISSILSITPVMPILEYILTPLFSLLHIEKSLYRGILLGIIEITNGIDIISSTTAPFKQQAIATVCLISWNGLSIHAQAISMIGHTDIKLTPYITAKLIQTIFAGIYGYILFILLHL